MSLLLRILCWLPLWRYGRLGKFPARQHVVDGRIEFRVFEIDPWFKAGKHVKTLDRSDTPWRGDK